MGMGNYCISSRPLHLDAARPHNDRNMTNVKYAKYGTFNTMYPHLQQLERFNLIRIKGSFMKTFFPDTHVHCNITGHLFKLMGLINLYIWRQYHGFYVK